MVVMDRKVDCCVSQAEAWAEATSLPEHNVGTQATVTLCDRGVVGTTPTRTSPCARSWPAASCTGRLREDREGSLIQKKNQVARCERGVDALRCASVYVSFRCVSVRLPVE